VNTKAKNVVVFDNQIARRKYDFFTYNNILGRSGRMFQHFIGHVYVFRNPPAEQLPLIDVPVFTQPDDAPDMECASTPTPAGVWTCCCAS
jgi:hypothetical protein